MACSVTLAHVNHCRRRHAKRIGDQLDGMFEGGLQDIHGPRRIEWLRLIVGNFPVGQGHPGLFQQLTRKGAVLRGYARPEAVVGDATFPSGGHVFRDQDIESIGSAVHMIVDPLQFPPHRVWRVAGGAQHAKSPCPAHGRNHVAAMAEGHEGKLDSEHFADRGFHE
jgi:hypothetical protein